MFVCYDLLWAGASMTKYLKKIEEIKQSMLFSFTIDPFDE